MAPVSFWTVRRTPPYAYPPSEACLKADLLPTRWEARPISDGLGGVWPVDTWFQAVTSTGNDDWPRFSKSVLMEDDVADQFQLGWIVLDLDRPDHHNSPWETRAAAAEAVRATVDMLDASVYATRGGLRAVWELKHKPQLKHAQSWIDDFHATMIPVGLPVSLDRGVKDWTRGFRVPHCPRHDGKTAPWALGDAPSDLTRVYDGHQLDWRPRLERVEEQFRARKVVWPPRDRHVGQERREIRQIRGVVNWWCRRITGSESRHAVILAAGRHVGGLCAYYGVNPEEFVESLAAASTSGNAAKTARTAVDYGAHQPVAFVGGDADTQQSRLERAYSRVE